MKKILLVDSSPRKGANSEVIVDVINDDLKDADVTVFKMREKTYNHCIACGACQGKEGQNCVQKDDITDLLELIDQCDAIVLTTPIYNHQISSQAKLFIERFYPFFNINKKNMSNTSKFGKKGALICSFWGGPKDKYEKYTVETVENFSQIGVEETKTLVFGQIPNPGDVKNNEEYMNQIHDLSKWLNEE